MKLVRFLMKLTNEHLSVELKDGSVVNGTVTGVDNAMNIHMKAVRVIPSPSRKRRGTAPTGDAPSAPLLETYSLRGCSVRMIILPDNLQLEHYLIDDVPKANKPSGEAVPTVITRTRGTKRPRPSSAAGNGPAPKRASIHRR